MTDTIDSIYSNVRAMEVNHMLGSVFIEILTGIGKLFLHPFFYLIIFAAFILGLQRVKRERRDFNTRVYDAFNELKQMFLPGIVAGLALSLFTIGLGFILPVGVVVLIGIFSTLFLLSLQVRWLSPAYIIGLSIIAGMLLTDIETGAVWLDLWIQDVIHTPLFVLSLTLGMMMLAEGLLIMTRGTVQSSPFLQRSKRGKLIGLHEVKRLWLIPVFFLVPGGSISSSMDWWPMIQFAGESYALILAPFGIGFHQNVRSMLPQEAIKISGKQVTLLSVVVLLFAVFSFWFEWTGIIAAIIAIVGREAINYRQRIGHDENISFFSVRDQGMVILGVIPKSPAEKMALQVGEIITKINGETIRHEKEFYEALQKNRAFCKLEVLDFNGEVRFVQRALYEGEHHELGLLFVNNDREWSVENTAPKESIL